ncbi:MAG TPA: glycosyl hydrolase family 18 protein [Solirubrobacteraceae bacterium]|nr:glycosyl hydrolase family 18 protein [Solirubrobacteraceae bacterium]
MRPLELAAAPLAAVPQLTVWLRRALPALALLACLALPGGALGATYNLLRARPLHAYLLTSAPDSLRDLRAHARSIGVVYPTYFDCAVPSGRVVGAEVPEVTAFARSRRIVVMPRFNCQDGATVHRILTSPALRAATLARLASIARSPAFQGLNLDFENDGAADRGAMTDFVAALASRLHAMHKKLSVVAAGVSVDDPRRSTGFYDPRALAALADTVFVMAWGAHWQGSAPGPIAPLGTALAIARYLASLPNASRFVLGAPMYGIDWAAGGGATRPAKAYQYSDIVALAHSVHAHVRRDPASAELTFDYTDAAGVAHQVWSMDAQSVASLLRIGRQHGLGTGLWRLGLEDQRLWSSSQVTSG